MEKMNRRYLALMYIFLVICGAIGYYFDKRVFLLVVFGLLCAVVCLVTERVYKFLFLTSRNIKPRVAPPYFVALVVAASAVTSGVLFFQSQEITNPSLFLGIAIASLHYLLRDANTEAPHLSR